MLEASQKDRWQNGSNRSGSHGSTGTQTEGTETDRGSDLISEGLGDSTNANSGSIWKRTFGPRRNIRKTSTAGDSELVEIRLPKIKLEVLSNWSLFWLSMLFLFTLLLALAFQIESLFLSSILTNSTGDSDIYDLKVTVLAMLGVMITISVTVFLFVLVAFTQRIFVRACCVRKKKRALPQQIVVILSVTFWFFVPQFNVAAVIDFWQAFNTLKDSVQSEDFEESLDTLDSISSNARSLLLMIFLNFSFVMFILVLGEHTKGISAKLKKSEEVRDKVVRDARRELMGVVIIKDEEDGEDAHIEQDGLNADDSEAAVEEGGNVMGREETVSSKMSKLKTKLKHGVEEMKGVSSSAVVVFCFYAACCWICCSKRRFRDETSNRSIIMRSISWRLLILYALYFVLFIIMSLSLEFEPSILPTFGLLTVLRVCLTKDPAGFSFCSLSEYPRSFNRALATALLTVFEVLTIYFQLKLCRKVYTIMGTVPYALNRANYLGFAFFVLLSGTFFTTIFLLGLLDVTVPTVETWIYPGFLILNQTGSANTTGSVVDPLYQVGITSGSATFVGTTTLTAITFYILGFVFLPADSSGFMGWFLPSKAVKNANLLGKKHISESKKGSSEELETEDKVVEMLSRAESIDQDTLVAYFDENPVFVPFEADFEKLLFQKTMSLVKSQDVKGNENEAKRYSRGTDFTEQLQARINNFIGVDDGAESPHLFGTESVTDTVTEGRAFNKAYLAITGNKTATSALKSMVRYNSLDWRQKPKADKRHSEVALKCEVLMAQVRSHVLVFETEMEMFNFSHIVYAISSPKTPLSNKEKERMIESETVKFVQHIHIAETDTHALVAASLDRVVISFRGTVTGINVKTDLDLSQVLYEEALCVEPIPQAGAVGAHYAARDPKVHAGFLTAYRSAVEEIYRVVDPLLFSDELESFHGSALSETHGQQKTVVRRQKRALFCTGHSLGGGLAVLCGFDFARRIHELQQGIPAVSVTTFGCPRVCNFSFLQRFKRIVPSAQRFVLATDIIPKTPPRFCWKSNYTGYFHVGLELLLDLRGNLLIGPNFIEIAMIHGLARPNKTRHFMSRYAVGLLFFHGRLGLTSNKYLFWSSTVNKACKFARQDILSADETLLRSASPSFFQDGVTFQYGKIEYRTSGCQTIDSTGTTTKAKRKEHSLPELAEGCEDEFPEESLAHVELEQKVLKGEKLDLTRTESSKGLSQYETTEQKLPVRDQDQVSEENLDAATIVDDDDDIDDYYDDDIFVSALSHSSHSESAVLGEEGARHSNHETINFSNLRAKLEEKRVDLEAVLSSEEIDILTSILDPSQFK